MPARPFSASRAFERSILHLVTALEESCGKIPHQDVDPAQTNAAGVFCLRPDLGTVRFDAGPEWRLAGTSCSTAEHSGFRQETCSGPNCSCHTSRFHKAGAH